MASEELKILRRKIHHFSVVLHTNLKITNQITDKECAIYVRNLYWPLDYSMVYFRLHRKLDNGKELLNEKFCKIWK